MKLPFRQGDFSGKLNQLLYGSRKTVLKLVVIFRILTALSLFGLLVFTFGFYHENLYLKKLFDWFDFLLLIYVITYLVRMLYTFRKTTFFRENKFETGLIFLILLNGVLTYAFDIYLLEIIAGELSVENYAEFYLWFLALYIWIILGLEFIKLNSLITTLKLNPSTTFVVSFVLLIAGGAALLSLPTMTTGKESIPLIDALFTSTSATCVTGLIVVDTGTYFTFRGQLVILLLIQLGGLGILSFATFFGMLMSGGIGFRQQLMMQNFLSEESLKSSQQLLRQIFTITLLIEIFTFGMIYFSWDKQVPFDSGFDKIFSSAFHAVSAFCNAGFSLFTNGLNEHFLRNNFLLQISIISAVIMGGIGFGVIEDLFSPSRLRDRLANPWRDWAISTKIAIFTSFFLLAFGMLGFFLLENQNVLEHQTAFEKLQHSFFQSATTRTAGFNTVDIAKLSSATLIMFIFLMFIGASSGSVGGGIKTSTFFLIVASVGSTLRGKNRVEIGRRFIPNEVVFRALSIFSFAVVLNFAGIFVLSLTDPQLPLLDIAFEQFSAFATVGLSTGITSQLSGAGKIMIIISMFLGRVGTLTFALALSKQSETTSYRYPKGHVMIG
jgi:potassium uptake TrkH family protein